jgi:hypothetical protein
VLNLTGHREEAVAHARRRLGRALTVRRLGFYGLVLGMGGATDEARAILRKVEAAPEGTPGRVSALSRLYFSLGDTTHGLDALARAAEGDGDLVLSQSLNSPHFDAVRRSARFATVLRRFNLDVARLTAPDGGRSR